MPRLQVFSCLSNFAQQRHILGARSGAHPAVILDKGGVEHPVQVVFDQPVGAHNVVEPSRIGWQATQAVRCSMVLTSPMVRRASASTTLRSPVHRLVGSR